MKAGEGTGPAVTVSNHRFTDSSQFDAVLTDRINRKPADRSPRSTTASDADSVGDHFVVIVGRAAGGETIINDPGSTANGNGAANPYAQVTHLEKTTRRRGMNLVRLMLHTI